MSARVSDPRQKTHGHGLESQEHRCRAYAEQNGHTVAAVFRDDIAGGGDFEKRPGLGALFSFLDTQKGIRYIVIFDDLKRFARETEFHLKLRRTLSERGVDVGSPNFRFGNTAEDRFVETVMAAQGEL